MRTLAMQTIVTLATLTLAAATGHAQSTPPARCGIETWSTEKMSYVSTPCADGPEAPAEANRNAAPALSGNAAYCAALISRYDRYLNRDSRLGAQPISLETRAGAEKCRVGDPEGIAPLEKALRDARIELPKRS